MKTAPENSRAEAAAVAQASLPAAGLQPETAPALASPAAAPKERSPIVVELRPLRVQLVKRMLKTLANYLELPAAEEHVMNRPDVARALVEDALEARASDIHLEPRESQVRVRLRVDGLVLDAASLSQDEGRWVINQFKALANLDPVVRFSPKDSHARLFFGASHVDLRLALAPCRGGEVLSIRLLDPKRLERAIDDLGLSEGNLAQLQDWLENVNGMFLAAGPTGCGKTTTLYALLHQLKFSDRIVLSIEDPVEYEVAGMTQVQLDEKHHLSFAEGVKAMLRLDPDFLMMGEIRDASSSRAAVDAAVTGRVLMSTVHARDAVGVVTALRNWGLADHDLAETLAVVIAQRLVRRLCLSCRKETEPSNAEAQWLKSMNLHAPARSWSAPGCNLCHGTGYHGRTGIFELWRLRPADSRLILAHCDEQTIREHLAEGMHSPLFEDGLAKAASGITSLSELRRAASGGWPFPAIKKAGNSESCCRP